MFTSKEFMFIFKEFMLILKDFLFKQRNFKNCSKFRSVNLVGFLIESPQPKWLTVQDGKFNAGLFFGG